MSFALRVYNVIDLGWSRFLKLKIYFGWHIFNENGRPLKAPCIRN